MTYNCDDFKQLSSVLSRGCNTDMCSVQRIDSLFEFLEEGLACGHERVQVRAPK